MSTGGIGPSEKGKIIENPENYEDMKKKLQQREEEAQKKVFEKLNVTSPEQLAKLSSEAIKKRQDRTAKEHKPLKDYTVISNASSDEIEELKQKLNTEIKTVGKKALDSLPQTVRDSLEDKVEGSLKGRITQKNAPVEAG